MEYGSDKDDASEGQNKSCDSAVNTERENVFTNLDDSHVIAAFGI